ncbi:hypothetical protein DOK67_0000013 [Enterococcus sp. DIV0212c]|nr:hypothetical protein [Enterococcus sp. DIV0212c]
MIKIKSVYTSYEDKSVLADCSLEVYQGEIYGLLWGNGRYS